jgi:hypothetical protein
MGTMGISTMGFAFFYWLIGSAIAAEQLKEGTADTGNNAGLVISLTQAVLLVSALAACITCIYMVFFFGRRLQTSAYFRESLISAAKQEELGNLLRGLDEKRRLGPLDEAYPPPDGFEFQARYIWHDTDSPSATIPHLYDETDEQRKQREAAEEARLAPFKAWVKEERKRYSEARQKAEIEAQGRAEKKVPASIDISLLGGGWSFLLEFSTVIVIIFVLLCLGLLGTVTGKDIITVLAAIAGYVLGKASSVAQKGQQEKGVTPQQ